MKVWISAGFGRPVGRASLEWLKSLGIAGIRTDIPWGAPLQYRERLLVELAEVGLGGILIIGGGMEYADGGEIKSLPRKWRPNAMEIASYAKEIALQAAGYPQSDFRLEIGNEPNIETQGGPLANDPKRFGRWLQYIPNYVWQSFPDTKMLSGGICFLNDKSLQYLERAFHEADIPENLTIGLHPYRSDKRQEEGIEDLETRLRQFRAIIGPREYAITEIGWHTAPQQTSSLLPCRRKEFRFTDEDISIFASEELDFWQHNGAAFLSWFQLNDGKNEFDPEERYGIRDFDGFAKPVAGAIRRYTKGLL